MLRVAREFNIPIDEALRLLKGEANPPLEQGDH